jgi:hypothetical protein
MGSPVHAVASSTANDKFRHPLDVSRAAGYPAALLFFGFFHTYHLRCGDELINLAEHDQA